MEQPTNYLRDIEQEVMLIPADKGLRFVNLLIDTLVFYAIAFVYGIIHVAIVLSQGADLDESYLVQETGASEFLQYLVSILLYLAYYTIFEAASKGRTLGKLVTGTVVMRDDGNTIGWKEAFLRSLCRLIPLEAIVAIFTQPWHDSMTRTVVVKKIR